MRRGNVTRKKKRCPICSAVLTPRFFPGGRVFLVCDDGHVLPPGEREFAPLATWRQRWDMGE